MASQSCQIPNTSIKSQYHHFIPRFLLRNFSNDAIVNSSTSRGKRKRNKWHRGSDQFVNILDFHNAKVDQRPIAKEFGLVDMYRDQAILNQHDLEIKLSRMESQASVIISKSRKALDSGSELVLTRFERDTIRKFFFMMKYRNSRFYDRFNHESVDTYDSDDKHHLVEFLKKGNFSSPKAVWFSNIHAFLDLHMDAEMKWMQKILDSPPVYPDDARMFIYHMQSKFMAFCTVSDVTDEFILSENAYGVHEGPVDSYFDPSSGKLTEGLYTEHHTFAPLSPKLLVVFRSFHLPSGFDEGDTQDRELIYETLKNMHINPSAATSILEDLPVEKCRNSYMSVIKGKTVLNPGPPEPRSKNKFFFRFFPLSTAHVQLINTIFLENAWRTSSMVFKSSIAMRRALRLFLEDPRPRFKVVENTLSDPRLRFLRKLEIITQKMGSKTKAIYNVFEIPKPELHMTHWVGMVVGLSCVKEDSDLRELYGWLSEGANSIQSFTDVDQACKMAFMAVKTDVILSRSHLSPDAKIDIKLKRQDLFASLPRQRVWLYLKIMRNLQNFDPADFKKQIQPLELKGPEDFVACNLQRFPPAMAGQVLFRSLAINLE